MSNNNISWKKIILDFFETTVAEKDSSLRRSRNYIDKKRSEFEKETDPEKKQKILSAITRREKQLNEERSKAPKTEVNAWITKISKTNIKTGYPIHKVTHATKFINSSTLNEGLIVESEFITKKPYLCSENMQTLTYDFAHNNGSLVTISRFLALKNDGKLLIDFILEKNFEFLGGFYQSQQELEELVRGLSDLVINRKISSADKLKGVYFPCNPTNNHNEYHLLIPLYATSLSHEIYKDREASKYTKRAEKFSKQINTHAVFTSMAYVNFGGDNIQNVSMLNASRRGKGYVFSCQPPVWKSQNNQFLKQEKIFDNGVIRYQSAETLNFLVDFILRCQRIGTSSTKPKYKDWLARWITDILTVMTDYADEIIFTNSAGWTQKQLNKFKQSYRLWLDPYYDDEYFQQLRVQGDWQMEISRDFAKWLSTVIKYMAEKKDERFDYNDWWENLFFSLAEDVLREHDKQIKAARFEVGEKGATV